MGRVLPPGLVPVRVAGCPNCGGQVEFRAGSSLLAICAHCSSAVARIGDDITELEVLGKVAPLADLGSPISVGISGRYRGAPFRVAGQVQLDHGAGPWNEWYVVFDDETWGWIAEAQGRVYFTTGKDVPGLPPYGRASPGTKLRVASFTLTVAERKRATFRTGSGELPFRVEPGKTFRYVDVQGPGGVFGTIDYGDGDEAQAIFLGEELEYDAIFDRSVLSEVKAGEALGHAMNCPSCGAAVELMAPNEAMRVTCRSCDSLLDASRGTELHLLSSAKRRGPDPIIPLSSVGTFDGTKYTVFGFLVRSVTVDGVRYTWEEYLLHAKGKGYRWLVFSNNHWTFVDPVNAADVEEGGRRLRHAGLTYRHFQSASAMVEHLRGEFYWKVEVGERAGTIDYVCPPFMLTKEVTSDEVNWSRGRYLEKADVERAFRLERPLRRPFGVAPNMPNRHGPALRTMMRLGAVFSVALLAVAGGMAACSDDVRVVDLEVPLAGSAPLGAVSATGAMVTTEAFEIGRSSNLEIRVSSDVRYGGWLYVGGKLINESLNEIRPFGATVRMVEGKAIRTIHLGELSSGKYVMQLVPEWRVGIDQVPTRMKIEARRDVFVGSHAATFIALLWVLPLLQGVRYSSFEKQRWSESDHA
jgi:hypothetical protein